MLSEPVNLPTRLSSQRNTSDQPMTPDSSCTGALLASQLNVEIVEQFSVGCQVVKKIFKAFYNDTNGANEQF